MSLFEFFILALYLSSLASIIVIIQVFQPVKSLQDAKNVEIVEEPFLQSEFEEPDSDEEKTPFNPETENYVMTENPMLRKRNREAPETGPAIDQVD
jgi:hypothetical protein